MLILTVASMIKQPLYNSQDLNDMNNLYFYARYQNW